MHARVDERFLDLRAVDRHRRVVGVLLDDREQVAEQSLLGRRQLGPLDRQLCGATAEPVDRRAARVDCRRRAIAVGRLGRARLAPAPGRLRRTLWLLAQIGRGVLASFRYVSPSSYRLA
jgi:hypothetical protein